MPIDTTPFRKFFRILGRFFVGVILFIALPEMFHQGLIALLFILFWTCFLTLRKSTNPFAAVCSDASLPLALGLTPHVIFLAVFDDERENQLPGLARLYENAVIELHSLISPLDDLRLPVLLLILCVSIYASMLMRNDGPIVWFIRSRKAVSWTTLFLTSSLCFTVFTGVAAKNWSPDVSARLAAKDRQLIEMDAKLAVIDQVEASRAARDSIVAALSALNRLADHVVSTSRDPEIRFASRSDMESAMAPVGVELADDIVKSAGPAPQIDVAPAAAPSPEGSKLDEVRAKSVDLADRRESAKRRTEALVGLISADLGLGATEPVAKFIDELIGGSAQVVAGSLLNRFLPSAWADLDRLFQAQDRALRRIATHVVEAVTRRCADMARPRAFRDAGLSTGDRSIHDLESGLDSRIASAVREKVHPRPDPHPRPEAGGR